MARQKSEPHTLDTVAGLGEPDAELLLKHHVKTPGDLWGNGAGLAERLESKATAAGVKRELLYGILIADALDMLRPKGWARRVFAANRHWNELAFVALLLLAVLLLAYRGVTAGKRFTPRVEVKAESKLLPFRAIEAADLTLGKAFPGEGTFSSTEKVIGRYPSDTLLAGKPVTEDQLMRDELSNELATRHLLVITVNKGTATQPLKTPAIVWLLFPPPDEKISTALLVKDVMILAVRQDGERVSVTVALTENGLAETKDRMGRTEAVVIQPATGQTSK